MRYMVEKNFVRVLGYIWMPRVLATMEYPLNDYHVRNIGEFTRENVEDWLSKNAGDFCEIVDFEATVGDQWLHWEEEENGLKYDDLLYGAYDE